MVTEIRPVTSDEVVDYIRVLPQATGLPIWEPEPAAWYAGHGPWPPRGTAALDEAPDRETNAVLADWYRSQAAIVNGQIVGGSAMLSLELTVPGLRQVAMGGVTSTGVLPTHRRRGLLRALMTAMFRDCRDRGEFLAGLSASEGTIYGRYGFSPATFQVRWELERTQTSFIHSSPADASLQLVDADVVKAAWPDLHERVRQGRVGEVSATPGKWDGVSGAARGADGPLQFLIHRTRAGDVDGIAHFRTPWSPDPHLIGTVQVEVFEAATPAAYSAMWRLLTDLDLTRRIVAGRRPPDEPLRWMLANPRAVRVTRASDNLWLRLLDVGAALEARTYNSSATLTLAVCDPVCPWNEGNWRLDAHAQGATCRLVPEAEADLAMGVDTLASLYLSGVSPAALAAAGRIVELRGGALTMLTRLLQQDTAPFNAVGF